MDDYEIVPKEELFFLKEEVKKLKKLVEDKSGVEPQKDMAKPDEKSAQPENVQTTQGQIAQQDPQEMSQLMNLQDQIERLNDSLSKLFMLFERAKSEIVTNKPEFYEADFRKVQTQNEKIASGIIAVANMIKDQQIQINQLNTLYTQLSSQIKDTLPKKRDMTFKIPPMLQRAPEPKVEPKKEPLFDIAKITPQGDIMPEVEIPEQPIQEEGFDIPPRPLKDILTEEKTQSFPSVNLIKNEVQPPLSQTLPPLPEVANENIPPPPRTKKTLIDKFLKK